MSESENYTETNDVEININVIGEAAVIINGQCVDGEPTSKNQIILNLEHEGDVLVTVNGEDFMVYPDLVVSPDEPQNWVEPRDNKLKPSKPKPVKKKGKKK